MTYEEALSKKIKGDWIPVSQMCGITSAHSRMLSGRPKAKKYNKVMDALIKVIESREILIIQHKSTQNEPI